jgi:outer membrane protein assembly factor BamB
MWRCDAARSAASGGDLPAALRLEWTREYAPRVQVWDDPLNNDIMSYDRVFEPIVLGETMLLGFNDADKLVALDVRTGRELWTFYTDGPVRLPPAGWKGMVYAASDDGHLYCLDVATGKLKWKFRGGPSAHKTLGNGRIISMWPARGGPVVRERRVYFAAGIWPFLGVFIYALDAETGKVEWTNDRSGAVYALQPHGAPAFGTVAPQGALVATRDMLLVPGGRSLPAAFIRKNGMLWYYENSGVTGGKQAGGSLVIADDARYFVRSFQRGVKAYALRDTHYLKTRFRGEPVLAGDMLYVYGGLAADKDPNAILAADKDRNVVPAPDKVRNVIQAIGPRPWELEVDGSGDLILAGGRLYAAGKDAIRAIDVPKDKAPPKIAWTQGVEGHVMRLLAGGGRLFAVTLEGRIMAFGAQGAGAATLRDERRPPPVSPPAAEDAKRILQRSGVTEGYALCYGVDDGDLLMALAANSRLRVVAVDPDGAKVDRLRGWLDSTGLYGGRVSVQQGDPASFKAPPYFASLVLVGKSLSAQCREQPLYEQVYRSLRPYGGALRLAEAGGKPERWEFRTGAPPGAADWTHQYGNVANTVKSDDSAVRLPLGILWFGGNSHEDVLPRHGHGPPEQVAGGRLVIEGLNCLIARDVYTGRQLWKTQFRPDELATLGIYYDETYSYRPQERSADQRHAKGANARGTNYVLTDKYVYVALRNACRVLDAATGKTLRLIEMPQLKGDGGRTEWGFLGLDGDLLLGGWGFAHYSKRLDAKEGSKSSLLDISASRGLVAMDVGSGHVRWKVKAKYAFIHNGIVAGNGRVYCLDKLPPSMEETLRRHGAPYPGDYRIVALDAKTGATLWEKADGIFGAWLSYSAKYDTLLMAVDNNHDRFYFGQTRTGTGMAAYCGKDGALRWKNKDINYSGPCILLGDVVLPNVQSYSRSAGALRLLDGSPVVLPNPVTGVPEPWSFSRAYGCNSVIASEHLLTFRSGAASYYDLDTKAGTGNFGGFKSGCTSNLVVADGVLNAPEYTRTCLCTYQNQTSLALVHMPDLVMERWTAEYGPLNLRDFSAFNPLAVRDRVKRVGINFGGPGDRMAPGGTLWLEYPAVGGESYEVPVSVEGGQRSEVLPKLRDALGLPIPMELRHNAWDTFRRHEAAVEGPLPWVAASCLRNVKAVTIDLDPGRVKTKDEKPQGAAAPAYTVRLCFAELEAMKPGERVFDVSIQGRKVLENFDVVRAAGAANRSLIKQFSGVRVADKLRIDFQCRPGSKAPPFICGVEAVEE